MHGREEHLMIETKLEWEGDIPCCEPYDQYDCINQKHSDGCVEYVCENHGNHSHSSIKDDGLKVWVLTGGEIRNADSMDFLTSLVKQRIANSETKEAVDE